MRKKITFLFLVFAVLKSYGQQGDFDKGLIAFDSKNFKEAISKLKPFAEKGNCVAQFAVGFSYMYSTDKQKDTTARRWLLMAAEQKFSAAMGPLAASYFGSTEEDANVKAYMWAMLAAEYNARQKFTTTRVLIKSYLKPEELQRAEALIKVYKDKWKDTPDCK
jgi:TPR repeat protein